MWRRRPHAGTADQRYLLIRRVPAPAAGTRPLPRTCHASLLHRRARVAGTASRPLHPAERAAPAGGRLAGQLSGAAHPGARHLPRAACFGAGRGSGADGFAHHLAPRQHRAGLHCLCRGRAGAGPAGCRGAGRAQCLQRHHCAGAGTGHRGFTESGERAVRPSRGCPPSSGEGLCAGRADWSTCWRPFSWWRR